ncbi:MAG TPA: hypothetical protein VIJ70_04025, partial [Gaiellaceae bacterium]
GAELAEDLERQVGAAAVREQLGCAVQVDVRASCELGSGSGREAGALELLGAPELDELLL